MDWLTLLFIVYITYFFVVLFVTNGKMISPSLIFSLSFSVMIGLAMLYREELEFAIKEKTFWVMSFAGLLFICVEFVYAYIFSGKKRYAYMSGEKPYVVEEKPIYVQKGILTASMVISVLFVLLSFLSVFMSTGGGTFAERMNVYKTALLFDGGAVKFRFLIAQILKVLTALVYVLCYIWIYNYVKFKQKFITNWSYTIIFLLFLVGTFVSQGARQPAIELIIYCIFIFFCLRLRDISKRELFRIIRKVIPIILIIGALYYYTMNIAGRNQTPRALVEYVAANFSGGLYYFDSIINTRSRTEYFGQYSFSEIYKIITALGFLPETVYKGVHENGRYGNTLTIFGRWFEDFGSTGVFFMTIFVAMFFSWMFYCKILRKRKKEAHIDRIIYCKLSMALVWAGYDDRVRALLSIGNLIIIFMICFFYAFFIKKKIRIKIKL